MKPRILVIDDEGAIRDSLRMILEYEDYQFVGAASGQEGLALAQRERPDLVLLDIKMPGMDGMEVLRKLHALDETLPVVMISGHGTTATAVDAIRSGATDFLDKPLSSERVIVTLRNALTQSELRTENRELRLAMESRYEIVGQSPALDADIERGDVILEIDRHAIHSAEDYDRAVARARPGDVIAFYVYKPSVDERRLSTVRIDEAEPATPRP